VPPVLIPILKLVVSRSKFVDPDPVMVSKELENMRSVKVMSVDKDAFPTQ